MRCFLFIAAFSSCSIITYQDLTEITHWRTMLAAVVNIVTISVLWFVCKRGNTTYRYAPTDNDDCRGRYLLGIWSKQLPVKMGRSLVFKSGSHNTDCNNVLSSGSLNFYTANEAVADAPRSVPFCKVSVPPCFMHNSMLLYRPMPKCAASPLILAKGLGPFCKSAAGYPGPSSSTVRMSTFPFLTKEIVNSSSARRAGLPIKFSAAVRNRPWYS